MFSVQDILTEAAIICQKRRRNKITRKFVIDYLVEILHVARHTGDNPLRRLKLQIDRGPFACSAEGWLFSLLAYITGLAQTQTNLQQAAEHLVDKLNEFRLDSLRNPTLVMPDAIHYSQMIQKEEEDEDRSRERKPFLLHARSRSPSPGVTPPRGCWTGPARRRSRSGARPAPSGRRDVSTERQVTLTEPTQPPAGTLGLGPDLVQPGLEEAFNEEDLGPPGACAPPAGAA